MSTVVMHPGSRGSSAFSIPGFRDVDGAVDKDAYFEFLDDFAALFHSMAQSSVDLLRLTEGDSVLDVGCGHGACVPLLAQRVGAAGRIVGVDVSHAMVDEARRRYGKGQIPVAFQRGEAQALAFDDATFHAARADRVLFFVDDPRQALSELTRVVRPGGRIVVTEGDLGSHVIDAADVTTTRAVLAGICDRSPNGGVGRRLRTMFIEAGLRDVELHLIPILTTSFAEWNHRLGVESFVATAIEEKRLPRDAALAWLDDLKARDAKGQFTGTALLFLAAGTRLS